MAIFTHELRRAVDEADDVPVPILDPETHRTDLIIKAEVYDRLRTSSEAEVIDPSFFEIDGIRADPRSASSIGRPTMSTAVATKTRYTPEDLLALPDGKSYELVHGQLVERNMGAESSRSRRSLFLRLGRVLCRSTAWEWPGRPTMAFSASPRSRPRPQAGCLVRPPRPLPWRCRASGLGQDSAGPRGRGRLTQRSG